MDEWTKDELMDERRLEMKDWMDEEVEVEEAFAQNTDPNI
jgi:hypothetical protein